MGIEQVIEGNFDVSGIAATAGNTVFDIFSVLLYILLLAGAGIVIWFFISYKHTVIIRSKTKNRKFIIKDKAKTKVIDGVTYWNLLKTKRNITPPPMDAIEITAKGRYFAECYWEEGNPEPIWLKDTDDSERAFDTFDTQERALHVAAVTKAALRQKTGLLEQIAKIAMPVMMVVCVAIPFVFYGELSEPQKDIARQNAATAASLAEITAQNARMVSVLAGKLDAGELEIIQEINNPIPPEVGDNG